MNKYQRQISTIGYSGQKKISKARILIIGCGGVGSPAAIYLTSMGIGKLIIVDNDTVECTNLHRQILYNEADIGLSKAAQATKYLLSKNHEILIESYDQIFDENLADTLLPKVDLIIDGTDNYASRYLINKMCSYYKKILISCSVSQKVIQVGLFDTNNICYQCLYPEPPPASEQLNCNEQGVLGCTTGIAGTITAQLAINYLLNPKDYTTPVLKIINSHDLTITTLPIKQNPKCEVCKKQTKSVTTDNKDFGVYLSKVDRKNTLLIDIREKEEREIIKLNDDLHYPISQHKNNDYIKSLEAHKLIFYCASGKRSSMFVNELRKKNILAFYLKDKVITND